MRTPAAFWALVLAVGALAASAVLVTWTLVLTVHGAAVSYTGTALADAAFSLSFLAYGAVGAVVAPRFPRLVTGWIFVVAGLCMSAELLVNRYALNALFVDRVAIDPVIPWITQWLWVPAVLPSATLLPLTFPNGRLPSRRWRPALWLALGALMLEVLSANALYPGPLLPPYAAIVNPFGVSGPAAALVGAAGRSVAHAATVLAVLCAAASAVARFRAAGRVERQQLKWLACAAALHALVISAIVVVQAFIGTAAALAVLGPLVATAPAGIPIAAGLAVLRYRLYDIDVVINRALVYGGLTAALAVAYWGGVVLLQTLLRPVTQGSELAVAGSTLLVAALFQPLRSRIQDAVDRRFYRRKYDAARTLDAFTRRLREQLELEVLEADLVAAVGQTVQPTRTSLWLRGPANQSEVRA